MGAMVGARKFVVMVATAALLVGACGGSDSPSGSSGTRPTPTERDGGGGSGRDQVDAAPDFTVQTFAGERFSLAEQRGTPVVLNFWESW